MAYNVNGEEIISNDGVVNAELGAKAVTELPDGTTIELSAVDELGIYDAQSGELKRFRLDELDASGVISGVTTSLNDIGDVDVTNAGIGSALVWNGTNWIAESATNISPAGALVLGYRFSSSTTMADPGTGRLRVNNSNQYQATQMAVDVDTRTFGADMSNVLLRAVNGTRLVLQKSDDAEKVTIYVVNEDPVLQGTAINGWISFPDITSIFSTQDNIPNNRDCMLALSFPNQLENVVINPEHINTPTIQVTASSGIGMTVTSDVSIGGSVTADFANVTNANVGAALTVAGVTELFDHLIIDDSTGLGSEYAFNVKNSGTSAFGVLGNGNVLLGSSSASPFIAVNDHHATSKKYVDDAITSAVSAGVVTALNDIGDVDVTNAGIGSALVWDGSNWVAEQATNISPAGALILKYRYSSNNTMADPGGGFIRTNNTNQYQSTALAVDVETRGPFGAFGGSNMTNFLLRAVKGTRLILQRNNDPTQVTLYSVNADPVLQGTAEDGWISFPDVSSLFSTEVNIPNQQDCMLAISFPNQLENTVINPSHVNTPSIQVTAASGIGMTVTSDVSIGGSTTSNKFYGELEGNVTGNLAGDSTGLHNGDVYSRDGSQLVLEVPTSNGDAHYIGTVTGDVTGNLTGDSFGTHTGQTNGDVYTADGATQVVDTANTPSPIFKGDAEGLSGTPNISVNNVSAAGSITVAAGNTFYGDGSGLTNLPAASVAALDDIGNVDVPLPSNGEVLTYNTTSSEWEAQAPQTGSAAPGGLLYNYQTNTGQNGTPTGRIRFNNTNPALITGFSINVNDRNSVSQASFFASIGTGLDYLIYVTWDGGAGYYQGTYTDNVADQFRFTTGSYTGALPPADADVRITITPAGGSDPTPSITENAAGVSISPPNGDGINLTTSGGAVNIDSDAEDINLTTNVGGINLTANADNITLTPVGGEVEIQGNLNVTSGGVISGDGSGLTNVSDTRWKTGITTIGIGMSFIEQVNPIRFQYQKPVAGIDTINSTPELTKWDYSQGWELRDPHWRFGFSAQELSSIEHSIGGPIGIAITDNPEQYQMRTEAMLPILVNAVKELKAELDAALARIDTLENP